MSAKASQLQDEKWVNWKDEKQWFCDSEYWRGNVFCLRFCLNDFFLFFRGGRFLKGTASERIALSILCDATLKVSVSYMFLSEKKYKILIWNQGNKFCAIEMLQALYLRSQNSEFPNATGPKGHHPDPCRNSQIVSLLHAGKETCAPCAAPLYRPNPHWTWARKVAGNWFIWCCLLSSVNTPICRTGGSHFIQIYMPELKLAFIQSIHKITLLSLMC